MSRLLDPGRRPRPSRPDDVPEAMTYAEAGVDVPAYNALLERVRPLLATAQTERVTSGVGPFAGLYRLPGDAGHLAASVDGVGTKIKVAIAAGQHAGIGVDLVNHCVNDVATSGATPLFFLDYFACGTLDGAVFEQVVNGLVEACREAGCALLGGETAEMPDVYGLGEYDLAGFVIGHLAADAARDQVRAGDVLVGLPASGLHTNGFSLVRRVFAGVDLDTVYPELGRPLADELLASHRSYLKELRTLPWKAAAHITGGGLVDNVPRALPPSLGAELDTRAWEVPPVFRLVAERGGVADEEMCRTFNMGLGMVLVAAEPIDGYPVVGRVVEHGSGPRLVLR
jgi:phosphoribosylformylglycinamidine cyclo-ligase